MDNGVIDQQLKFAREVPDEVLEVDTNLSAGYDIEDKTWELIVKYSGNIEDIVKELDIRIEVLSYGYAIIIVKESLIEKLSEYAQIEYIEKPRRLYFSVNEGKKVSCIDYVQREGIDGLFGKDVIVAIIDSGIDYTHKDFRESNGKSRILRLWDQTVEGKPPQGFIFGTEFSKEDIDKALSFENKRQQLEVVNSVDVSGHGTHVAGIACGNGRSSGGRYTGIAPLSDIVVVKIGDSIGDAYPRTTRLLEALEYVIRVGILYNKPVAINMSFGNNYGDHRGYSILEQYIDEVANSWKNNICIGAGNEGEERKHVEDILFKEIKRHELSIGPAQAYLSMQLWKNFNDDFKIDIISPSGKRVEINKNIGETATYELDNTIIYVYYGEPTPINVVQEINVILYPKEDFVENGIWIIEITPQNIISGRYDIWLGSTVMINEETGFIEADVYKTLTIPSTSYRAITVGAYNGITDSYVNFSGRGAYNYDSLNKPDMVAPGVNIISTANGGGYESRTGTSMATPFVTGSVALMMEWGIVRRNDPYFYGEKIKAYLIRGARQLEEFKIYPNPMVGWGALCLKNSIRENI